MDAEQQYITLVKRVLTEGKTREDRTGTGTISIFGSQLDMDISQYVPVLTTKKLAWKSVIKELLWFLRGETNAKKLAEDGVHIWDGNTTRHFLDSRGLTDLPEGDIGAGYGFQWRHFGADYSTCKNSYQDKGFDQISWILNGLKVDPYSRRHFLSAWNPASMHRMALPPCHVSAQFYVEEEDGQKYLSCHVYQRSVDCFLGLPFNIFSYAVLTYIFAKKCDFKPKRLLFSMGDIHIYKDHIDQVTTQMNRVPYNLPKLILSDGVKYSDFEEITIQDFTLQDYQCHPAISAVMSI